MKKNKIKQRSVDNCIRTDSSTSVVPSITGHPWSILGSVIWGTFTNRIYRVSGTGIGLLVRESGMSDCIIESLCLANSVSAGLSFRVVDANNYYYLIVDYSFLKLYKMVAGVSTLLATLAYPRPATPKVTVKLNGNNITIYVDNFFWGAVVDSSLKGTKHGLYAGTAASNGRWSSFNISPIRYMNSNKHTMDFEDGVLPWYWIPSNSAQAWSQTWDTSIKRSGTKSMRMEVRNTDPDADGSKRSEVGSFSEQPLEEHWYTISTYLPSGGADDYALDSASVESFWQWHNVPDTGLGETFTSPPLLLLTSFDGHYHCLLRWDDAAVSTNASMNSKGFYADVDLGDFTADKGQWVDWVMHVKWGWLPEHNPILELYKNGVKIMDRNGMPNTMNDQVGTYMKFGIYKWDWKSNPSASVLTKRVIYFDNVSVN